MWRFRLAVGNMIGSAPYTRQGFENECGRPFEIRRIEQIRNSERTLYLMERR